MTFLKIKIALNVYNNVQIHKFTQGKGALDLFVCRCNFWVRVRKED